MARIISVVNQKGGVGKTTTAVSLASILAEAGRLVLLVDMDPQGNATSGFGYNSRDMQKGLYEVLLGETDFRSIALDTIVRGCRLAPATMSLAGASVELVNMEQREFRLKMAFAEVDHVYDYIIIDCPPSLGLLTVNALAASREVVIPVQAEYYALEGLGQLVNTINLVRENLNPDLSVLGVVLTMYDKRNRLSRDVMDEIYQHFPDRIFRSVIPRAVRLAEAPSHGKPITLYDAGSKGARSPENLAREIIATESAPAQIKV